MSLSQKHISPLSLVDHLEIWFHEMPPLYISNTVDMGLNPKYVIPKCLLAHVGDTINK